jgi:hypothetical protein
VSRRRKSRPPSSTATGTLKLKEAAALARLGPRTYRKLGDAGELSLRRFGRNGRIIRIDEFELKQKIATSEPDTCVNHPNRIGVLKTMIYQTPGIIIQAPNANFIFRGINLSVLFICVCVTEWDLFFQKDAIAIA